MISYVRILDVCVTLVCVYTYMIYMLGGAHYASLGEARYTQWAGPNMRVWVGPIMFLFMYGMWYFGEITKLCAYGFQFMFHILHDEKGRVRDDCRAHTTFSAF